jgi:cytochrome c-type biogenesis protein CcmH/NrfG
MDRLAVTTIALAAFATVGSVATGAWLSAAPPPMQVSRSGSGGGPDRDEILRRVEALENRLRRQPEYVDGLKMLGRSYVALGRLMDAVSVYSQAAQLAPNDSDIRGALADLSARASAKHDDAIRPK